MGSWLYFLNVSIHLLAAMFWLGGMFFFALIGAPTLRRVEPATLRATLFERLGERFRAAGWIAIGLLVLTGAGNLWFRGMLSYDVLGRAGFWSTAFGRTLGWKAAAVTVMIGVSAVHDFALGPAASRHPPGSPESRRARRGAAAIARVNALLGVLVVLLAVRLARGG